MTCKFCSSPMENTYYKELTEGLGCESIDDCTNTDCDYREEFSYGAYRERYRGKYVNEFTEEDIKGIKEA